VRLFHTAVEVAICSQVEEDGTTLCATLFKPLTGGLSWLYVALIAQMAELVDAPASGAGTRKGVEVRVLFWAPILCLLIQQTLCIMFYPDALPQYPSPPVEKYRAEA
jgi:hypothetical protein